MTLKSIGISVELYAEELRLHTTCHKIAKMSLKNRMTNPQPQTLYRTVLTSRRGLHCRFLLAPSLVDAPRTRRTPHVQARGCRRRGGKLPLDPMAADLPLP